MRTNSHSSVRKKLRAVASRPGIVMGLLVLMAISAGACDGSLPPPRSLLLVSFDTLRADHTSVHGYRRRTTPRLAALAAEGLVFETAYAPSSTTGPSHATLFTGQLPLAHGVVKNGLVLGRQWPTLAERARASGVQTAGFPSSFVLDARFGLERGFDAWDDDFAADQATMMLNEWEGRVFEGTFDRRSDHTTDAALAWLRVDRDPDRAFFLFVHYMDVHDPYTPPASFAGRFGEPANEDDELAAEQAERIAAYDAEIAFADAQLGRLIQGLDSLGLAGDTLVVVTADHGEGLGDHGALYHGVHVYEAFVHVPLVLRFPGGRFAGRRERAPVGLVDLMPTLSSVMGWGPAPGEAGMDLIAGLDRGGTLDPERPVHLHRRHYEPRTLEGTRVSGEKLGVRVGRWKYLEATGEGTRELYDLEADPGETVNAIDLEPEVAARLAALVEAQRRSRRPLTIEVDSAAKARLEAMGYVE